VCIPPDHLSAVVLASESDVEQVVADHDGARTRR